MVATTIAGAATNASADALMTLRYAGGDAVRASYGDLALVVDSVEQPDGTAAPRLAISAADKVATTLTLNETTTSNDAATVKVVNLDSDRPQVLFQHDTDGAHCCIDTKIATRIGDRWAVIKAEPQDGEVGFSFIDAGDGDRQALVSADDSFLYAFTGYASSLSPIRIQLLEGAKLVDVTAKPEFRNAVKDSLARLEGDHQVEVLRDEAAHPNGEDPAAGTADGYWGAWVATKALLGEGPAAWAQMLKSYPKTTDYEMQVCTERKPLAACPDNKRRPADFPEALRSHLFYGGYIKDLASYPLPAKAKR